VGPRPILIAGLYALIAVVMTWPLAPQLATGIAADLGDPVFNAWVLLWTSGQALAFLSGDWDALGLYWHGNIFHPERYTLAYSEHLTPQMLQALPIVAITGNILVAYNLLFLSTFALCGLGVYLLVRDLTGRPLAAFVAGLAFAWAPYRIAQVSHLQILTSYWMPLAFVGFHRYFAARRVLPLAGGASALALQGLSCGYFLLYFPPFAAAYCLYEIVRQRLARAWRVWLALGAAAIAVALVTWPFVEPYLILRAGGEMGVRSADEVSMFSADVRALGTAAPSLRLWGGTIHAFPKPEGEGFPGFTIALLALVAVAWALWRAGIDLVRRPMPAALRLLALSASVASIVAGSIGVWIVVASQLRVPVGGTLYIYNNPASALSLAGVAALVAALALAYVRRADDRARHWPVLFFACALVAAALLSFGPTVMSDGRPLMPGPYALLHAYVPGFDGSRVPARFLMLVALCLSVLAGLGAGLLARGLPRRAGGPVLLAAAAAILAESWVAPFSVSRSPGVPSQLVAPADLRPADAMSPLYRAIENLPGPVVLIEFPFGEPAHDLQAMFYAGHHRRPIVNGYSGYFPPSFFRRVGGLWDPLEDPARAAGWLADSAATHALVHEAWFAGDHGLAVSEWLASLGARLMVRDGTNKLFELK
jgi:hypothetical protein